LGITTDELSAAYQKANEAALAQAVEQGLITQAQADQINAQGTAFPFSGRHRGWFDLESIDYNALLADALGISVDELQAAYAEAYVARIDQAVTDGNLTQEQADLMKGRYALYTDEAFQASMQSAFEVAVQQAVSSGVITQAQADQILADNDLMKGFGMGFGGKHGFGDFGGGHGRHAGRGFSNPQTPVAP
jgi:hypothetical protein